MPQSSTVYLEKIIKRWTIARRQLGGYLKDVVAPMDTVTEQSGKYKIYGIEGLTVRGKELVGDRGDPGEVDYKYSEDSYFCKNRARKHFISADVKRLAEAPLKPEQDGANLLVDVLQLGAEIRVRDLFQTLRDSATTSNVPSVRWDAASGAKISDNIMERVETVLEGCSNFPNYFICPLKIMRTIIHDPVISQTIRDFRRIDLIAGKYPPVIHGMQVLIPGSLVQTADYGVITAPDTGATVSQVWNVNAAGTAVNDVYLVYANPNPGPMGMNFANQLRWTDFGSDLIPDKMPGANGGNWIKTKYSQDEKIVGSKAAYCIKTVLT